MKGTRRVERSRLAGRINPPAFNAEGSGCRDSRNAIRFAPTVFGEGSHDGGDRQAGERVDGDRIGEGICVRRCRAAGDAFNCMDTVNANW